MRRLPLSVGLSNRAIRFLALGIWALQCIINGCVIDQLGFLGTAYFQKQTKERCESREMPALIKLHRSVFIETEPEVSQRDSQPESERMRENTPNSCQRK